MNEDFENFEAAHRSRKSLGYEHMNELVYLELLEKVAKYGELRQDRTGVGTRALFGETCTYNLLLGFPLLTTKYVSYNTVYKELLWILSGSTDNNELKKAGVNIWTEWEDAKGQLGPIYGHQWRCLKKGKKSIDQIKLLIESLTEAPHSRRHIVSSWNPLDLEEMALTPCHNMFQCYVSTEKDGNDKHYLDLILTQRSCDIFLGAAYNIASYSILMYILGHLTNLTPRYLKHNLGDVHLYSNHVEQAKEQLSRVPKKNPKLKLNVDNNGHPLINQMRLEDYGLNEKSLELFRVDNYDFYPKIEAEVAV